MAIHEVKLEVAKLLLVIKLLTNVYWVWYLKRSAASRCVQVQCGLAHSSRLKEMSTNHATKILSL
jgi:hypothetical protein